MRYISVLAIGAALASAPAMAGEIVWGGIELGMARSAVEAAYPKGGKTITTATAASKFPMFESSKSAGRK